MTDAPFAVIEIGGVRQTYSTPGADAVIERLPVAAPTAAELAARLADRKAVVRAAIEVRRDAAIAGGFFFGPGRFQSDATSARNIEGYAISALKAEIRGEDWRRVFRLEDNSDVVIDRATMMAIGDAWEAHKLDCYQRSWVLKGQLDVIADDPSTEQALAERIDHADAVPIGDGWPGQEQES